MDEGVIIRRYLDRFGLTGLLSGEIIQELRLFRFAVGDYIVRTEDHLTQLYFMVDGKAKVFLPMENGKSLLIRFYEPMELIGDVEFVGSDQPICDMQAISDVVCLGLCIETLKATIESHTQLLMYICTSLGNKLAAFNKTSAMNQMYPLENRLASYLMAVSSHDDTTKGRIKEIHTENLTELADLLGTSYRQLTRVIKRFKDQGILHREGRRLEITDMMQMQSLARGIYA